MVLDTSILSVGDSVASLKKQLDQGVHPGTKMTIRVTGGESLEIRVNLDSIEKNEKGHNWDFAGMVSENYAFDIIKIQREAPIRGQIYPKDKGIVGTIKIL